MKPIRRRGCLRRGCTLLGLGFLVGTASGTTEADDGGEPEADDGGEPEADDGAPADDSRATGPDGDPVTYEPTWESLDQHEIPGWYEDGKLGIFLHWGSYSVAGKLEWYPEFLLSGDDDIVEFHEQNYGPVDEYPYRDFLRETDTAVNPNITENFTADEWDPERWASFFESVGVRYVVLTAEHCDGIPLWDPDAKSHDWNTVTMGPERDLVADLGAAVRDQGIRWGVSEHSMLNWYEPEAAPFELYGHPEYTEDGPEDGYVQEWRAKIDELLEHSKPDLLWLDGDWTASAETWGTKEVVADYYNTASEEWGSAVLVNDRLGQPYPHDQGKGDYATLETTLIEYSPPEEISAETYEAVGNINPDSWGYQRNATPEMLPDAEDLVHQLVGTVSTNGNFLIGLGPKPNGEIPDVQREPVLGLGTWLDTNGEAIYGTRPWVESIDGASDVEVRYTVKDSAVYAIALEWPGDTLRLDVPAHVEMRSDFTVELLGVSDEGDDTRELDWLSPSSYRMLSSWLDPFLDALPTSWSRPASSWVENSNRHLAWHVEGEELVVDMPNERPAGEHADHAYAVRIQVAESGESALENTESEIEESDTVVSRERIQALGEQPDIAGTDLPDADATGPGPSER